jgi:hypothetical protein
MKRQRNAEQKCEGEYRRTKVIYGEMFTKTRNSKHCHMSVKAKFKMF